MGDVELEDVDLAKALHQVSLLAAKMARDIVLELDAPERSLEVAAVLEDAARLVRERANALPRVITAIPVLPPRSPT